MLKTRSRLSFAMRYNALQHPTTLVGCYICLSDFPRLADGRKWRLCPTSLVEPPHRPRWHKWTTNCQQWVMRKAQDQNVRPRPCHWRRDFVDQRDHQIQRSNLWIDNSHPLWFFSLRPLGFAPKLWMVYLHVFSYLSALELYDNTNCCAIMFAHARSTFFLLVHTVIHPTHSELRK